MTTLHLQRELDHPDVGDWAVYRVLDSTGVWVGGVAEFHEARDDNTFGPATWVAVTPAWSSPGHPTPQAALEAIADHLARARNR